MREILFRGKRVDNGEWLYGFYATSGDKKYIIVDNEIAVAYVTMKEVEPETVGQYTGLTENGVKIFEGDILDTTNSNSRIWYVDYKNTAFCCNQRNANYSCVLDDFMRFSDVEVIGNIHDNPELLEGGADNV